MHADAINNTLCQLDSFLCCQITAWLCNLLDKELMNLGFVRYSYIKLSSEVNHQSTEHAFGWDWKFLKYFLGLGQLQCSASFDNN